MFDVVFILPGATNKPIGGYKVVYEYANRMSKRGHRIGIVHCSRTLSPTGIDFIRGYVNYLFKKWDRRYVPKWFNLDGNVHVFWYFSPAHKRLPNSKSYVATAWDTAQSMHDNRSHYVGKTVAYLIQGYEVWAANEEKLAQTYRYGFKNIAVSHWLQKKVEEFAEACQYVPNGLNFSSFYVETPIVQRNNLNIIMLYHPQQSKGFDNSFDVVSQLHDLYPSLKLQIFGAYEMKTSLPKWASYAILPDPKRLRMMLNEAGIFVTSSENEGWGLTACEAMQCGCALVASDIPGHREFAIHLHNALLSPIKDKQQMLDNLVLLVQNDLLRVSLANNAVESMKKYNWDKSVDGLLRLLGL